MTWSSSSRSRSSPRRSREQRDAGGRRAGAAGLRPAVVDVRRLRLAHQRADAVARPGAPAAAARHGRVPGHRALDPARVRRDRAAAAGTAWPSGSATWSSSACTAASTCGSTGTSGGSCRSTSASAVLVIIAGLTTVARRVRALGGRPRRPGPRPRCSSGSASRFEIQPAHFVERHGALMIVAFGESVADVGIGAGGQRRHGRPRPVGGARAGAHRLAVVGLLRHRRRRPRGGVAGPRRPRPAAPARARRLLLRLHPDAARHRGDRRRAAERPSGTPAPRCPPGPRGAGRRRDALPGRRRGLFRQRASASARPWYRAAGRRAGPRGLARSPWRSMRPPGSRCSRPSWRPRWPWKAAPGTLPLRHDRQVHAAGDGPGLVRGPQVRALVPGGDPGARGARAGGDGACRRRSARSAPRRRPPRKRWRESKR